MCIYTSPDGSDVKASAYNAGDPDSIPGLGRSPGEGNGNPLQYSCLENSMDRGVWRAAVQGVTKTWTPLSQLTLYFKACAKLKLLGLLLQGKASCNSWRQKAEGCVPEAMGEAWGVSVVL